MKTIRGPFTVVRRPDSANDPIAHGAAAGAATGRWRRDLAGVLVATVASYVGASALELNELFNRWVLHYERWQLDELPLAAIVFFCGLSWFALRRRGEAEAALRWRELADARAGELLAHNRELAQQLIALQENERLALARELHDEFGQRCSAIRAEAAWIRACVRRPIEAGRAGDPAGLLAAAERIDDAAGQLHIGVREMLRRLRPANLDTLGLVAALQELCEAWEERSGISCVLHHDAGASAGAGADDRVDITVYRVTQEALNNVMRHAGASAVRVVLARQPGVLRLSIQDDGVGMDVNATTQGLGLLGARERASALGGSLRLESSAGRGLRVSLSLPTPTPASTSTPVPIAQASSSASSSASGASCWRAAA